jgi:UDP-N-acetylglucosamine--N-acetylmuramyl-(pentapeptide) pyrophosphoryl-undecaprenol N-acetylglucosamine transferase
LVFAGGGTGGHLFPALAIADEVRSANPQTVIVFVGTKDRIEARVVPQKRYELRTIWAAGVQRKLSLKNVLVPLKIVVSLIQSFFVMRSVRPGAVIGTGGYVCGPVLLAARLLGIPTVIHESNSLPGVTTRLLAGKATKVFLGFEDAVRHLKRKDNVEVVGTPTRKGLGEAQRSEGLSAFRLDPEKTTVLVFGGSLGAASLNTGILSMIDSLDRSGTQVIWQTGSAQYEQMRQAVGGRQIGWVGPFIDKMELAYAAADVVLCRAGATTIAELIRVGKPAILVAYPFAAEDHQTRNAQSLVQAGAAEMMNDADVPARLETVLLNIVNNKARRESMAAAGKRLNKPDSARIIADYLLRLASTTS